MSDDTSKNDDAEATPDEAPEATTDEATTDAAEPAAEAKADEPAAKADDAAEAKADEPEEAPAPEPTEEELAAQAEAAEAQAAAAEMVAEVLKRATEGDREAVAELGDEDLRELAAEQVSKPKKGTRFIATGKRKTSVARVIVERGTGKWWINGKDLEEYFPRFRDREAILEPIKLVDAEGKYNFRLRLHGGGMTGQSGAARHGISRALGDIHPSVRRQLKSRGFMKLDTRQVERKKAGLKKARKRPQFSKR